jgi:hypothetical protein
MNPIAGSVWMVRVTVTGYPDRNQTALFLHRTDAELFLIETVAPLLRGEEFDNLRTRLDRGDQSVDLQARYCGMFLGEMPVLKVWP